MVRLLCLLAFAAPLCAQDDVRRAFNQLAAEYPGHLKVADFPGLDNGAFVATARDYAVDHSLPCVVIVGSLHFREHTSAEACLHLLREVIEDEAARAQLKHVELVLIPCVDPAARMVRSDGVGLPFDDDRDGQADEDGPSDLNGGGIHQMRVRRKGGRYVASSADPRILIEAPPGGVGEWDLYWEGKDDDGDGRINEDARGTITLYNDWSIRWDDKQPGANRFMMQLKQTRALANFLLSKPLLAGFQLRSMGAGPDFAGGPPSRAPRGESTREDPLARDKGMAETLKKLWGEVDRAAIKAQPEGAGNFIDWLYESQGALAANLPLAVLKGQHEDKKEEGATREKPGDEEQRQLAWLAYQPGDYAEWKAYQHPQLGEVEIGGWRIGARSNPTEDDLRAGAARVAGFIKALLSKTPRVEVSKVEVEDKGAGLWRVRATLHNAGTLDYRSAFAERSRIGLPLFVSLTDSDAVQLISGTRRNEHENLHGGATGTFEWLVRAAETAELQISVESERTGNFTHRAVIKDCPKIRTEEE